jgi:PAS domain S-box-containing protein
MTLNSFLTRLIWICVVPLVLLSAYLAVDQVRSLQVQREQEAAGRARNFATSLDYLLASRVSALQVLADSPLLDDSSRLDQFYRQAQGYQRSFQNHLLLADSSRHMVLMTRTPFGTPLPDLPEVKGHSSARLAAATGKPAVGDLYLGPVSKQPSISIAVPVLRQGRLSYLLLGIMEADLFQKRLDQTEIPPGCTLSILDGSGGLIARRSAGGAQGPGSAGRAPGSIVIRSAVSPWSVVLTVHPARRSSIQMAALALAAAVLAATLIGVLGGKLAGRRLSRSVQSLALSEPPLAPVPEIAEIEKVRAILLAATAGRAGAESTLGRSEERYRSLVENAPLAIFVNRGDRIEYANPAALRLFGVESIGAVLGKSPRAFVHPDFHQAMAQRIACLFAGGRVPLTETLIRQPSGAERSVEVVAAFFSDRQGPAIQVMMQDISERKRAETALRDSEERYRELVQNANSAIIRWDRDGRITFFNEYAQSHFGYRLDEVLGRPVAMLVAQQEPGGADPAALVQEVLARPERYAAFANENVCRDGRRVWTTWTNKPILDAEGRVLEILAVGSDITQAKLAELALQEREERLRRAEEMAHLGHWRLDLVTGQVSWSDEMYRIFGLEPGVRLPDGGREEVGIARFCHPDDLEPCLRSCDPRGGHDGESFAYRIVRPDGGERHLVSRGELLRDVTGAPAALFGTLLDSTELRHKERELQEKNAELERFTYMISHDLKSPLVTVKTFLAYLERDLESGNGERVEQDLQFMRGATDRMGRLLDELLEMSRVGRIVNPPAELSCGAVVDEAVRLVAGALSERGVELAVALPELALFGDQARLVEIWQNLVENACKFMGEEPHPRIEIGARGSGRGTVFFVRDNGIGIEAQYLEKVFGLFEKLDRGAQGTGLGLALVRRIVELNGGKIWAESPGPGAGTCISFTLPGAVRANPQGVS